MESNYTIGEWQVQILKGMGMAGLDLYQVKDANNHLLAKVHGNSEENVKANAKLISAAPDLLEACNSIYTAMLQSANMSEVAKEHYKDAIEKCKSAIQKATV